MYSRAGSAWASAAFIGDTFEFDLERRPLHNLKSREFFLAHSRNPESFGLRSVKHSFYELERPDGTSMLIRSMLSTHEIALLYACARDLWDGGAIVDLGPLVGASTWALAKGLMEREKPPTVPIIHSFDLWRAEGAYSSYLHESQKGAAGSVLGEWIRATEGYHDVCEPHQGDLSTWEWDERPISILFVDVAKTWELNNQIVSTMFPCLQPGGILIQQDYIHWNEYWIHLEMARFRAYFEHCQFLRGATSFYRCIETPPLELCLTPGNSLDYEHQIELLESERELAPASIQEVMKVAAAKHAMDNQDFDRAGNLLESVSLEPLTDNPLIEVSGIAKSNHQAAAVLLAKLLERKTA